MEKMLDRLISALESKGFKKHGRATEVSKITGYSVGMVSDMLRGKAALSDRFLRVLCKEIGLSEHWVKTGEESQDGEPLGPAAVEPVGPYAKLREKLSPEKRLLFDAVIKMSDDEAEKTLQEYIDRLRRRQEQR